MKPGDHPEFFRFPAPEGRSRESTIRLDRLGRFWHDGAPVEHAGMAKAFASWLRRHPDDGRFILSNGYDWTYLTVEDTPFFVVRVIFPEEINSTKESALPELVLELSDGSQEPLDIRQLKEGEDGSLYVDVKAGEYEARFTQFAQLQLAPLLSEDEAARVVLVWGGVMALPKPRG